MLALKEMVIMAAVVVEAAARLVQVTGLAGLFNPS
jgi:hypothetical protein